MTDSIPDKWERFEVSLDGDHACALFGANLQEGEAAFVKIEGWPNASHRQECTAMHEAYEQLAGRLGRRLPFDVVRYHGKLSAPPPKGPQVEPVGKLANGTLDVQPVALPAVAAPSARCVVAPLEPTPTMEAAGNRADNDYSNNRFHGRGAYSRAAFVYKAMLDVLPHERGSE